MEWA